MLEENDIEIPSRDPLRWILISGALISILILFINSALALEGGGSCPIVRVSFFPWWIALMVFVAGFSAGVFVLLLVHLFRISKNQA
ncbi:MAG: hypothetical protein WC824_10755 [Bacteroidota bacterium]|jgi:hypothetical protein